MILPRLSVERPVFASVLAMLIVAFGVLSFGNLTTREYPDISPAQISITTRFPGAAADIVESKVTQPIEDQISGIEGIKTIRSTSADGVSNINVEFVLSRDIDSAANDVRDKISTVLRLLPDEADPPIIAKADSDSTPIIFVSLESETVPLTELTDYAERYVVDRFSVIPGVSTVNVYGGGSKAMRVWIDRDKLAARNLTISDITTALNRENLELPAGRIESSQFEFPLRLSRSYVTEQDFRKLIVAQHSDGNFIRLGDIADVREGSETDRLLFITNGRDSMGMGIVKQSNANTVEVLEAIRAEVADIADTLPAGMKISTSGDASAFIRAAINGVYSSIGLTTAFVALVIFLFLGTLRSTLIPVICIPVSLFGAFIALQAFGYTINLITLLAMVLAIGLTVDDAIVVLENIYRRMESGEAPLKAAYEGAREVGFAVIATTVVLIAVFTPIAFMQSDVGRIFSELALTISAAVLFSTLLSLTIVPMLCSKILRRESQKDASPSLIDRLIARLSESYERSLTYVLARPWIPLLLVLLSVVLGWRAYLAVPQEYAPYEDQDTVLAMVIAEEGTGINAMRDIIQQVQTPLLDMQENSQAFTRILFVAPFGGSGNSNRAFSRISLVPWNERDFSVFDLQKQLYREWQQIPGVRAMAFLPSGLRTSGPGSPVQFVLQGHSFSELAQWRDEVMDAARNSGLFTTMDSDLKETQQQVYIHIDKDRAGALGVTNRAIGETLQALMTEYEASTYVDRGEEYPIILQLERDQRLTPEDISHISVRSATSGQLIQLANLVTIENRAGISTQNRYNRMKAVTISAGLAAGVSLGQALAFLDSTVQEKLPATAKTDYKGESLEYKSSASGTLFTFLLALVILFLVMSAQFESFIHPTVIMVTVPLAITGGLLGLLATGLALNIFSQIAILMLVGIATKSGILLVEFINQLRAQGMAMESAIISACKLRLRPILMTTLSTLAGAIPLIVMTGPGSASRNILGIVVVFGVAFSTLLTLYLVPSLYKYIARKPYSPIKIDREGAAISKI